RRSGAADGEIAHQEDIAVGMSADKGMAAALAHVRVFADPVAQEPEAGRGIAAVVEAVQPGIEDHVPGVGVGGTLGVGGGEGVSDVVLDLRFGVGKQPWPLLDAVHVLGAAAGENDVGLGVGRIG